MCFSNNLASFVCWKGQWPLRYVGKPIIFASADGCTHPMTISPTAFSPAGKSEVHTFVLCVSEGQHNIIITTNLPLSFFRLKDEWSSNWRKILFFNNGEIFEDLFHLMSKNEMILSYLNCISNKNKELVLFRSSLKICLIFLGFKRRKRIWHLFEDIMQITWSYNCYGAK